MKNLLYCFLIFASFSLHAQGLKLTNTVLVAQLDRPEDKFTAEINLAEIFAECGVNVVPSLNLLKEGAPLSILVSDSLKSILKEKQLEKFALIPQLQVIKKSLLTLHILVKSSILPFPILAMLELTLMTLKLKKFEQMA